MVPEAPLEPPEHGLVPNGEPDEAYSRFPQRKPARYRDGWLPD